MNELASFATIVFIIQTAHSIEELSISFHKKWYLFKMPFKVFLLFEIVFEAFWAIVIFLPNFPARNQLIALFLILMFANGVQHLVWAGSVKKYVRVSLQQYCISLFFLMLFAEIPSLLRLGVNACPERSQALLDGVEANMS